VPGPLRQLAVARQADVGQPAEIGVQLVHDGGCFAQGDRYPGICYSPLPAVPFSRAICPIFATAGGTHKRRHGKRRNGRMLVSR
jgi:hypothetical protein